MIKVKTVQHGQETRGTKAKGVSVFDKLGAQLKKDFGRVLSASSRFKSFIK